MKALIIGAGIAGPAAAMFLRRVGIEVDVFEARGAKEEEGAFLNLMPNGMRVLDRLGIASDVADHGFPSTGMEFLNARGRSLALLDVGGVERSGVTPIVIRRAALNGALRDAATARGIAIHHDRKLVEIRDEGRRGVVARFEDGTTARGDVLLGCDGIHSAVRRTLFPEAPSPTYTGIIDSGGFARADAPATGPTMRMVFGRRAFFGYTRIPSDEVYWFSNHHEKREPERGELEGIGEDDWRRMLLDLHRGDPEFVRRIIEETTSPIGRWAIHDLPSLPHWHRGRTCLIGDAAHATSPHVGGGASAALEDAAILARCLRDIPEPERAFEAFQRLRRERVERLVREARRTGNQEAVSNPVLAWIRDLVLPVFLRRAARSTAWVHDFDVEWDDPVAAEGRDRAA